jgi:CheY-like chemotaxis protein
MPLEADLPPAWLDVLIVDDNTATSAALALVCLSRGLAVATAATFDEAVPLVARRPLFLFADMVLPTSKDGMRRTGVDLIKRVGQSVPECRCYLLTSATDTSVEDEAYEAGLDPHEILYKPIKSETILALVLVDPGALTPEVKPA